MLFAGMYLLFLYRFNQNRSHKKTKRDRFFGKMEDPPTIPRGFSLAHNLLKKAAIDQNQKVLVQE
jgi:hypothetical protein